MGNSTSPLNKIRLWGKMWNENLKSSKIFKNHINGWKTKGKGKWFLNQDLRFNCAHWNLEQKWPCPAITQIPMGQKETAAHTVIKP